MKDDERMLLVAASEGEKPRDAGRRIGIHWKRVMRLCEKWSGKGWYEWGVSCDLGWLEPAGIEAAKRARG